MLVAARLRGEYVRTIQSSIHRHRIASEHASRMCRSIAAPPSMLAGETRVRGRSRCPLRARLARGAGHAGLDRQLRQLLSHHDADIRRRALAMLSAARDTSISRAATDMLRDPDLGVRTEALLYVTREMRVDPLRQLEELGDVRGFLDPRRDGGLSRLSRARPRTSTRRALLLDAMAQSEGDDGMPDRLQAARVLSLVPGVFTDLLVQLIADPDDRGRAAGDRRDLGRHARRGRDGAARRAGAPRADRRCRRRLSRYGNALVPRLAQCLHDEHACRSRSRRELPQVLVRIGTPRRAARC